ncbi:MAG: hypothetical protein ACI4LB_07565 [Candidatus Fimenecus sp.]
MNIIKRSRAYYILLYLYFNNQMGYAQLKHIFGAESFECTKDAMQKLVRAKYVEKIQKQGINSFALTQNGHSICQRYFPSKVFCKPVRSANALDRVNRVNYERFIFLQLRYQLQSKTTVNEVCEGYFAPDEKEDLAAREPLAVQQVQGSTMSFALITKSQESRWTMYCFFFLYDKNKVFNETTEKNMMWYLQRRYADFLRTNGIAMPEMQCKAVFIADSYGLIAESVRKSLQTKQQRQHQYEINGFMRTRGAIVESTFGFSPLNIHFLVNDGDYSHLLDRIVQLLDDDGTLSFRLNQTHCGCCVLPEGSFHQYETAYALLVSENSRGKNFMNTKIFLADDQIPYITYIRDRYMPQERKARFKNFPVLRTDGSPICLA